MCKSKISNGDKKFLNVTLTRKSQREKKPTILIRIQTSQSYGYHKEKSILVHYFTFQINVLIFKNENKQFIKEQ